MVLGDVTNEPNYCKVCQECPTEIETREDINYHVMNDHEVTAVLDHYGHAWVEQRKHCIRRGSPFEDHGFLSH